MTVSSRLRARLCLESLEDRCTPATTYLATDLVSDQPGVGRITDPNLVNAWGISLNSGGGAFWVSSAGMGVTTLYTGDVTNASGVTSPLVRTPVPFNPTTIPGDPTGAPSEPTGQVFNTTTQFTITNGTVTQPSVFIFASSTGSITGWNPAVLPNNTAKFGFQSSDDAIYLGLALASNASGNFLFAADFHNAKIDVLDSSFHLTHLAGSFTDPTLPSGYAPFNVAAINGKLYVSYAKQDADAEDEVTGRGLGFVSVFDTNGNFERRLVSRGALNAPWGMVQAPPTFGEFGGALLVGNLGDGHINAFNPTTGAFLGALSGPRGRPLVIDGLWGLVFGNGRTAGDTNTLYYAAGPEDETHGLFGKITANPAGTNPVSAVQTGGELLITGSRDSDLVIVRPNSAGTVLFVESTGQQIGQFDRASVTTIRFNGFAGGDILLIDHRVTTRVIADGGAGNDLLTAGGGPTVLLGNAGDDILIGGAGRNILIGGDGRDVLLGFGNEDLLIAGRTSHDASPTALGQLLDAWNSAMDYDSRVMAIRLGTGGVPKLDATTVFDDGVRDGVFGGAALDWFFAAMPDIHDRGPGEQLN